MNYSGLLLLKNMMKMKILIVEDDNSSRMYLENLIELNGYDYKSASNGMEGLNIFDTFNPDIVITDIQMPVMDGLEMLETIRSKKSETIIIITTAYGSENYAIQALHLGANNYLKKPVAGYDLLPLLKKYEKIKFGKNIDNYKQGKVLSKRFKIEFKTSIKNIPNIVDNILNQSSGPYEENERINVELGLVELITNALEHGNLEISAQEKINALNENRLEELYFEKENKPELSSRKLTVTFTMDTESCEWIIEDQGNGFDWKNIKDPTKDDNILELSGRGIFISGFLFDELEYSGRGNIVRAKRYFNPLRPVAGISASIYNQN